MTPGAVVFEFVNTVVMFFVLFICIYPFINIMAISFNDAADSVRGSIYFLPRIWSVESYKRIFASEALIDATTITVLRTIAGMVTNVLCCAMLAYPLSKRRLKGRKIYFAYFIFTMMFGGGLVPTYMLYRNLGLIDNFAVYVLPGLIGMGTVLLVMMFFREIPEEIEESAKIDGANDFMIFVRIYMPLSLPCIATIALFAAVGHWNSWFDSMIFTSSRNLQVLQYLLQKIVTQSETSALEQARHGGGFRPSAVSPESVKAAITIVTTMPIIMVYPFLQKYFVKGLVIGSIKG